MATIFHPALHPLFESLGYAAGFAVYRGLRSRQGDALDDERRWMVIAAAAVGGLVGSRVLGVAEQAPAMGLHLAMFFASGGKTIVGGLLGGWAGVELAKFAMKMKRRTGDLFAIPLCVGIAVGRLGCFFAGLADDTYGTPTSLPWGVNFGDGARRHPTQLYEFFSLAILAAVLWWMKRRPHREGQLFRIFMAAYLAWRLAIDFIKPQPLIGGMNVIQWACAAGICVIACGAIRTGVWRLRAEDTARAGGT
ncbi:prolipoprotein diacylglyceryl transferase [Bryocella elongata]|uniref:prolipoprotein diacylglyceryl transferase n=1 Tax=Bryocella elongata TaxID=863522 RepID=UPI000CDE9F03|nr:prolipoprotein diacylglyceryl transferase family protein [Bryocella elongata]